MILRTYDCTKCGNNCNLTLIVDSVNEPFYCPFAHDIPNWEHIQPKKD